MNFKDRGNKKWTAMMLTDHKKELKKLKEHEDDKEKPILDDQEKEMINTKLQQAVNSNLVVTIKYYEDKRFKTISGTIKKIDVNRKIIFISDQKIKLENLLGIKLK
ncbi:MAG: YolD-like family protein [Candidatus Woesearchaeota archaeon]